ncbi:MAG TPA: PH domain-containing protein [Thermoanaerobaculia bacterium]|nr:PH domain-containing protein [Thermoanaerobaculia bacterium]
MIAALQAKLLELLRVPPQPDPPSGAAGSVRVFQAAKNFFRYQLVTWGIKQLGALWGIVIGVGFIRRVPDFPGDEWLIYAEAVGIASYLLQLPLTLLAVHLDFRMRWYIVTDRSLRVREGLTRVREQTMGFANIQNLSVRQGPLQRLLGIADLEVRTAGGGDGGSHPQAKSKHSPSLHLAYFRGVDNAEEIKDLILARLRRLRGSGLGDPDEGEEGTATGRGETLEAPAAVAGPATREVSGTALAAARELLGEARALRQTLTNPF